MPGAGYVGRLAGAALLGLVTLAIAFIIFVFLLPYLLPLALGVILLVVIFLIIWAVLYAAVFVGVALYYLFKPMKVSRQDKGYTIDKAKEAGRREKKDK